MLIDFITTKQVCCPCGETENLSVAEFSWGSSVHCNTCGYTFIPYDGDLGED